MVMVGEKRQATYVEAPIMKIFSFLLATSCLCERTLATLLVRSASIILANDSLAGMVRLLIFDFELRIQNP